MTLNPAITSRCAPRPARRACPRARDQRHAWPTGATIAARILPPHSLFFSLPSPSFLFLFSNVFPFFFSLFLPPPFLLFPPDARACPSCSRCARLLSSPSPSGLTTSPAPHARHAAPLRPAPTSRARVPQHLTPANRTPASAHAHVAPSCDAHAHRVPAPHAGPYPRRSPCPRACLAMPRAARRCDASPQRQRTRSPRPRR